MECCDKKRASSNSALCQSEWDHWLSTLLADTQALSWAKEPRRLVVCHLVTETPIRKLFLRQERNSGQTIGRDTSNTEPTANLADKSDNFEPESGQDICQAWLLLVVGQEILLIIRPDKCQRCSSERDKIAVLLSLWYLDYGPNQAGISLSQAINFRMSRQCNEGSSSTCCHSHVSPCQSPACSPAPCKVICR